MLQSICQSSRLELDYGSGHHFPVQTSACPLLLPHSPSLKEVLSKIPHLRLYFQEMATPAMS